MTKRVPAGCGQNRWPERRGGAPLQASSEPTTDDAQQPAQKFSAWAPVLNVLILAGAYLWSEHKGAVIAWGVVMVCALVLLAVALGADLHLPLG